MKKSYDETWREIETLRDFLTECGTRFSAGKEVLA